MYGPIAFDFLPGVNGILNGRILLTHVLGASRRQRDNLSKN